MCGDVECVLFRIYLTKSAESVYKHYVFSPLVQNPSKVSVKDRLGFTAKPAAAVEKVSARSLFRITHFLSEFLSFFQIV